jgi:hypothetical protein
LQDSAPPDRPRLLISFDEAGIGCFQDARDGLLTTPAREARQAPRSLTQPVPRDATRAMRSLAAFVCDDPEVQARLPQVLLASARLTPLADEAAMPALLPPGVFLWRETKVWTSSRIMVRLLNLLRAAICR